MSQGDPEAGKAKAHAVANLNLPRCTSVYIPPTTYTPPYKVMTCVGNGASVVLWSNLETMQLEYDVPNEALQLLFRVRLVE